MKKVLSFLTAILISCNVPTFKANAIDIENYYPRTAIVYGFDTESDTVKQSNSQQNSRAEIYRERNTPGYNSDV